MMRRSVPQLLTVGFVGLGQMGARMAPNAFASPGVTGLRVFDMAPAAAAQVAAACGGKPVEACASPRAVAEGSDIILTMLPNSKIVRDVYTNPETGVLAGARPGALMIDSSTVDPQTPRDLAEAAARLGAGTSLVDAPVSGGIKAAGEGTLTFMVGAADDATFARVREALAGLGKNIVKCGGVGAGQAVKLSNNMILAQHMVAVAEGMLLGTRLGVDPAVLAGCLNTSTGACWSAGVNNPVPGVTATAPAGREYAGGFGTRLMLKDVGLAIEAAEAAGVRVDGAAHAQAEYQRMVEAGLGDLDFSAVLKLIEQKK